MIFSTVSSLENPLGWLHEISRSTFRALDVISLHVYHRLWLLDIARIFLKNSLQNALNRGTTDAWHLARDTSHLRPKELAF